MTVFVLGYYWLTERAAIKRLMLQLTGPRHARRVNLVWVAVEDAARRPGARATLPDGGHRGRPRRVLRGARPPGVLPLALWAVLAEMIPMVGPYLAVAPALLVALTVSPTAAILLIYAVALQSLEGYVLVPRVMGRAVGVSPLVIMLGILAGGSWTASPGPSWRCQSRRGAAGGAAGPVPARARRGHPGRGGRGGRYPAPDEVAPA